MDRSNQSIDGSTILIDQFLCINHIDWSIFMDLLDVTRVYWLVQFWSTFHSIDQCDMINGSIQSINRSVDGSINLDLLDVARIHRSVLSIHLIRLCSMQVTLIGPLTNRYRYIKHNRSYSSILCSSLQIELCQFCDGTWYAIAICNYSSEMPWSQWHMLTKQVLVEVSVDDTSDDLARIHSMQKKQKKNNS
jgi:hypothetical protein